MSYRVVSLPEELDNELASNLCKGIVFGSALFSQHGIAHYHANSYQCSDGP